MNKFYVILAIVAVVGIGAIGYSVGGSAFGTAVAEPIDVPGLDNQETLVEMAQGVTKGNPDAPFTIVEFGDYQCPGCGGFALSVKPQIELTLVESGKAKFVFYDFPLIQIHPNAFLAARSARCAQDQGMFWEYHDVLFRNQSAWAADPSPVGRFVDYAEGAGLDGGTFEGCVKSDQHADVVTANMHLGEALGVGGTPTVMVQGYGELRPVTNNSFQGIEAAIAAIEESTGNAGN